MSVYENELIIGLIQTNLNHEVAWHRGPRMAEPIQQKIWLEIQNAFRAFKNAEEKPHIIILPELAVPFSRINEMRNFCIGTSAILCFGHDYNLDYEKRHARNQSKIFVPQYWPSKSKPSRFLVEYTVGKTYPSKKEEQKLNEFNWKFISDPVFYLFDGGALGRIGLCICYDFLDVERPVLYRGYLQHLIVLAHNRDIISFYHVGEALSRTAYCNVIVCNTGYFGGSVAISPYWEPYKRTIYRHEGKDMLAMQIIKLPVNLLVRAQSGRRVPKDQFGNNIFKSVPPGYEYKT